MQEIAPDFAAILEILAKHEVDFIVVGGVCAVLLGAPITTFDLDIVHSRSAENIRRLTGALEELESCYREHLPKRLSPGFESLDSPGHHLLATKHGPLDILGSIGQGEDYLKLEPHIETIQLEDDIQLRILDLETLICIKEQTARGKDLIMLEVLRAMKIER